FLGATYHERRRLRGRRHVWTAWVGGAFTCRAAASRRRDSPGRGVADELAAGASVRGAPARHPHRHTTALPRNKYLVVSGVRALLHTDRGGLRARAAHRLCRRREHDARPWHGTT